MVKTHMDLAKPFAPVDEYTGVPLPILPVEPPISASTPRHYLEEMCREDNHHTFFSREDYVTCEAGLVLRQSRLQYGNRWAHGRYHEIYQGVRMPEGLHAQFRTALLSVAGFVPEEAIDVRNGKRVELSAAEKLEMQEETVRPAVRISSLTGLDVNRSRRGIFFMNYVLGQDFRGMGIEAQMDEFLHTTDNRRRLRLGFRIFDVAFAHASGDIEDLYSIAKQVGNIHPTQPESPLKLVRTVVHGHQPNYFGNLTRRILETAA